MKWKAAWDDHPIPPTHLAGAEEKTRFDTECVSKINNAGSILRLTIIGLIKLDGTAGNSDSLGQCSLCHSRRFTSGFDLISKLHLLEAPFKRTGSSQPSTRRFCMVAGPYSMLAL